jgi:GTP-binding protein HflX
MLEREIPREKALVLHPRFANERAGDADYDLEEAVGLTEALDAECVDSRIIPVRELRASNFFGKGQIEEIAALIQASEATLTIVNAALSPIQQRNLERDWKCKVIDRTGLILEIFGLRAATKEGRLQVELARLGYERSRLVRTWTHLERQRGGQGFLAGPGETQIESDRRILNDKITKLRRDLENVRRTRGLQRKKRERAPERVVALVGYTNAGKSTLFNALTTGGVMAKDMLFATLDTTHRVLPLPSGQSAILSDTVGFISDLPTDLITAFRATLEEVKDADVLLHVRDISDPLTERRRDEVLEVLDQIDAGPEHGQEIIEVWNKADLVMGDERAALNERAAATLDFEDMMNAYLVSCLSGEGLSDLLHGVEAALSVDDQTLTVTIDPANFSARAWLHSHGNVLLEDMRKSGNVDMRVRLSESDAGKFRSNFPALIND